MKITLENLREIIRSEVEQASDDQHTEDMTTDDPDLTMYSETLNGMIMDLMFKDDVIEQINNFPPDTEAATVLDSGELFVDYKTINEVHLGIIVNDSGYGVVKAYYLCVPEDRSKSNLVIEINIPRGYNDIPDVKEWLSVELEDALSHELQHSCDPTEMLTGDIPEGEEKWESLENIYKHFGSEAETRGNVAGIVGRARRSGGDVFSILQDKMGEIFDEAIDRGFGEAELTPVIQKILEKWETYLETVM